MTTYLLPYSDGSVGVTAASATVTGTLTTFLPNVKTGDYLVGQGHRVAILSVDSNTALTLVRAWPGTTATLAGSSGQYWIERGPAWSQVSDLNLRTAELIKLRTYGTSVTSLAVGTGSKTLTLQSGLPFQAGARIRVSKRGTPTTYMEGLVTAYDGASMTFTSDVTGGSGTHADWLINPAGNAGAEGAPGSTGPGDVKLVRFLASGNYAKPVGLKAVIVTVVGAGASGGGVSGSASNAAAGGGGGGGGMARKYILASALGATETVTVGAGGTGVSGNNSGNAGGTTSFGSHCSATGGQGGGGMAFGTTAAISASNSGGIGSGGDINVRGGASNGGVRLSSSVVQSGMGGSSAYGGGGRAVGGSQAGQAGGDYGGGGAGASTNTASDFAGGAGAPGVVEIVEIY